MKGKKLNTTKKNRQIRKPKLISAKDISNIYGISYQVVNHYTDFGLLLVSTRKGNVRFYDRALVEKRLKKIRTLMNEGYSLRLIRKKLIGV